MYVLRGLRQLVQPSFCFLRYSSNMAQIGTIDFDEIRAGLENKSLMYLDVRNKSELQTDGQIVGSVNVPLPELTAGAIELGDAEFENKYGFVKPSKDAGTIVVGCFAGKRAAAAGEQLHNIGFTNIKVYPGSFSDWRAKGGPIVKP